MAQRDTYWDILKGILIVLVVIGHVMQLGTDHLSIATVNWIYSFHMPLFILVSGYFSNINSKSYRQGIVRLIETFIVFQLLRSFIEGATSFHELLNPRLALWYLLSLVYWKCMLIILPEKIRKYKLMLLAGSVVLSFISGLIHISTELSFQRTFTFMPFFVVGYILRYYDYSSLLNNIKPIYAIAVSTFSLLGSYLINTSLLNDFAGTSVFSLNGGGNFLKSRMLILLWGSLMSICIMRLSLEIKRSAVLEYLGQSTLHIYIFHAFFYMYLLRPLNVKGVLPNAFLCLIMYSLAVIVILYFTSKIKILNIILNPFTNSFNLWKTRS